MSGTSLPSPVGRTTMRVASTLSTTPSRRAATRWPMPASVGWRGAIRWIERFPAVRRPIEAARRARNPAAWPPRRPSAVVLLYGELPDMWIFLGVIVAIAKVPRRDKAAYADARRWRWGDAVMEES